MAKTDREDADHLTHSFLNLLASLYSEMKDYDSALRTNERNLQLTTEGTRWGGAQNQQFIDRRMALAKTAGLLARMGRASSGSEQSAYFQRADSAYAAWKAVQYEGNHTRAPHVYPSRNEHLSDSPRLRFQQLCLLLQVLPSPFRHDAHRVPHVCRAELT